MTHEVGAVINALMAHVNLSDLMNLKKHFEVAVVLIMAVVEAHVHSVRELHDSWQLNYSLLYLSVPDLEGVLSN